MRYTTISQIEKELNGKIEENIRIKTTVDVLKKRLFKERSMIRRKI
jgi:regulator of replication initiation timing